MSKDGFVFGVDLDGVCGDFYGCLKPIAAEWMGRDPASLTDEPSWSLPEWGIDPNPDAHNGYNALHRFAVTQRNLFTSVKPMPGAAQALRRLSGAGARIRIITHRLYIHYAHQLSVTQTVAWLDSHDFPYWDLCFMKNKAAVGADLYVDDSPRNIEDLERAGFEVIAFTNSTNRSTPAKLRAKDWTEVETIVRERMDAWRAKGGDQKAIAGR
jgi:5'(3')-deoxyribonucleotidase